MTWPRWTFTVISLMPMSWAICLLRRPVTTKAITLRSRGEGLEARPQRGDRRFVLQPRAISREAQLDRVQQVLIAERLGQELDRSSLYRLNGHRDIAVSGDEDDRNVNVRRRELSLKIETASARQPDIEHKASGSFRAPFVDEFGHRS